MWIYRENAEGCEGAIQYVNVDALATAYYTRPTVDNDNIAVFEIEYNHAIDKEHAPKDTWKGNDAVAIHDAFTQAMRGTALAATHQDDQRRR